MSETTPPYQIRWYIPKDFDGVKELIEQLAYIYNEQINDYYFKQRMQIRVLENSVGTFVAEQKNKVVGCAFADTERDPRGCLWGRISNVNVLSNIQGKGIGGALIDEAIQFLSVFNISGIMANVNPNHTPLVKLLEKRSFEMMFKIMEKRTEPFGTESFNPENSEMDASKKKLRFRTMENNDVLRVKTLVEQLAAIFNESVESYWFDLAIQKFLQDPTSKVFVAEENGVIGAAAFAEIRRDPSGWSYGWISNIFVDSKLRNLGVGTQLLHHVEKFLSNLNLSKIWTQVPYNNPKLEKLFTREGYNHKFSVMVKKILPESGC